DQMRAALEEVRQKFGEAVPVVIAGRREEAPATRDLANPSDAQTIVARIAMASPEQAQRAIEAADRTFAAWRDTPATERAALLRRVAAEFRRRRFEISAWQVFEVGKPWREADADVA